MSPTEMIEFARIHAGVVNPGGRFSVNPYYLGYTIPMDIEKRWDALHAAGDSPLTGREKLFEARRTEDDISLLRNYLTAELMAKLGLFTYGHPCTHPVGQRCTQCEQVVFTVANATPFWKPSWHRVTTTACRVSWCRTWSTTPSIWNTWTGLPRFSTAVLLLKRWPIWPSSGAIRCTC